MDVIILISVYLQLNNPCNDYNPPPRNDRLSRGTQLMFHRVLVANRRVAACRVIRTLRRLGIASVAMLSDPDRHALHAAAADQAVAIGGATASDSYLRIDRVLDAARATGAEAIHPGYGFLAENADFAQACADAGLVFIGSTPAQIRDFGQAQAHPPLPKPTRPTAHSS